MAKTEEEYIRKYLETATGLGIKIVPPEQAIIKTAEMAWAVDNYKVDLTDAPSGEPKKEGK